MTTVVEGLKTAHIDAATKRWDEAVLGATRMMHHADKEVRELTFRMLSLDHHSRWNMFGCSPTGYTKLSGFHYGGHDPCAILEEVCHFIGYHIYDDGEPGIGYHHYDWTDGPTQCKKGTKNAYPYFHNNYDILREKYPDAEYVSLKSALKVVAWYERLYKTTHERAKKDYDAMVAEGSEVDDFDRQCAEGPTAKELMWKAFIRELRDTPC
jgi:hypothetical protein